MKPMIQKYAPRLLEIWESLSRAQIRELNVSFQKAGKFENHDVMFLGSGEIGDTIVIYETSNSEKHLWVTINNSDPHGEGLDFEESVSIIKTKGVAEFMKAIQPKNEHHYGAYVSSWEEIVAAAYLFENEAIDMWPSDICYPQLPYELRGKK